MEPQLSVIGIIGVMGAAGAFGGLVNYLYLSKEQLEGLKSILTSILAGLAASFIMPLFLKTISSNLVANLLDTKGVIDASGKLQPKGTFEDVLVFAGFCLLAAISSKAFIQTLSDKVLREAREAKKQAKDLKEDVDEIEDTFLPLVEQDDTQVTQNEILAGHGFPNITPTQEKVLKALFISPYTLRSPSGLAKELKMERKEVLSRLEELRDRELVREITRKKGGIRWSISSFGQTAAEALALTDS